MTDTNGLLDALRSIQQYGLDTLSGRIDGPDDREWQRAAVNEMTKRARLAIEANGRTEVVDAALNLEAWALIEQHAKAWLRTAECRALIAKRNGEVK